MFVSFNGNQVMRKAVFILLFILFFCSARSQLVEVQANYTSAGDVDFVAYNHSTAPLFLKVDFADLQNTTFNEPLPYVKRIEPGFNRLFTLLRDMDGGVPRFHYQTAYFRSDPLGIVDLEFPYLIPLAPGTTARLFDVKSIRGFWGSGEPESWVATGFRVEPGDPVYATRNGMVVEIAGQARTSDPQHWYHTWNNTVTLLQPDGTLICYRNVVDKKGTLKVGEKVFAGQVIGEVASNATRLILLVYQNSIETDELRFIIPQFVTGENQTGLLITARDYPVIHPEAVRGKEMTRRERRKILKK